jgi:hypothetical protein
MHGCSGFRRQMAYTCTTGPCATVVSGALQTAEDLIDLRLRPNHRDAEIVYLSVNGVLRQWYLYKYSSELEPGTGISARTRSTIFHSSSNFPPPQLTYCTSSLTMGSAASKVASQPADRTSKSLDEKALLRDTRSIDVSLSVPKSTNGSIQLSNLQAWESTAAADPKIQLARTVLAHNNIKTALTSREAGIAIPHVFNTEVDFKPGPVTNQKSSGRCWLFATTNVIRYEVMRKLKLKDFQCSQVSVAMWLSIVLRASDILPE